MLPCVRCSNVYLTYRDILLIPILLMRHRNVRVAYFYRRRLADVVAVDLAISDATPVTIQARANFIS